MSSCVLFLVTLCNLLLFSYSENVLVLCGIYGSRLLAASEVATTLSDFGHNVTLFSPMNDDRLATGDRGFTFLSFIDERSDKIKHDTGVVIEEMLELPSSDMAINMLIGTDHAWNNAVNFTEFASRHFESKEFKELLENGGFDLIVVEDSAALAAVKFLVRLDTPIIGLIPLSQTSSTRDKYSLPSLLNSEPSFLNDISEDQPPSILQRSATIFRLLKVLTSYVPLLVSLYKDDINSFNGTKGFTDYQSVYDMVFLLDHPAYSFPFLTPPNTFYLGVFHLQNRPVLPLHNIYTDFLDACPHKLTAYMSFGSYLGNLTKFSKSATILRTISKLNVCLILKSETDVVSELGLSYDQILVQSWVPQKDLLGSGRINIFISHCGNNGRLESLYYNVPLLCIPLFMDQLHNARMVKRNGFGGYLTKEDVSEETFRESFEELVEGLGAAKDKIRRATDIVVQDPGSGLSALRFYSNLLIRDKEKARFLINKIILAQNTLEVNNLDILGVLFGVMLWSLVWVICKIYQCTRRCYRTVSNLGKFKTE